MKLQNRKQSMVAKYVLTILIFILLNVSTSESDREKNLMQTSRDFDHMTIHLVLNIDNNYRTALFNVYESVSVEPNYAVYI